MIDIDENMEHQVRDLVAESHDWTIFISDSNASPITFVVQDTEIGSMSGIDHTLEKDWSYFMAGDVSFTVHDLDNSLRTFLTEKTPPFKIQIYARYSNTSCPCFSGFLKMGDMEVQENDVTLYAISTLGWLEQYPYEQTINTSPNNYKTLRYILQHATTEIPGVSNLYTAGIKTLDAQFGTMEITQPTRKGCFFDTRAINQKSIYGSSGDCVYHSEDSQYYYVVTFKGNTVSRNFLKVYLSKISKTDPSDITEGIQDLFEIDTHYTIEDLRAIRVPNIGSSYSCVLLVGDVTGFTRLIIIFNSDYSDYRKWYTNTYLTQDIVTKTAGIDENAQYMGFATKLTSSGGYWRYYAYRISLVNLWGTGDVYDSAQSASGDSYPMSGDFTYDEINGNYYFVIIRGAYSGIKYYEYFRGTATQSSFVQRGADTVPYYIAPGYGDIAGSDKYFIFGGTSKYVRFNAFMETTSILSDSQTDRALSENVLFYGTTPRKIAISVHDTLALVSLNYYYYGFFQNPNFAYASFPNFSEDPFLISNYFKIRILNSEVPLAHTIPYELVIIPPAQPVDCWVVISKFTPFILSMTDGNTPANKTLGNIDCKEFIRQVVGSYLLTAHIHKDQLRSDDILVIKPRSGVIPYVIPSESIELDTVEVFDLPDFQIELTTQSQTFKYPTTSDPTKDTLSFQYNCLPPALGNDIVYYLYQQFQIWIRKRIKFKADSLFYLEPADWVRFRDGNTLITYDGVVMKNLIGEDGLCEIEILGKEV